MPITLYLLLLMVSATITTGHLYSASGQDRGLASEFPSYYQQWRSSPHANLQLVERVMELDPGKTTCLNCHTSSGFLSWISGESKQKGEIAPKGPVSAITCSTCHDLSGDSSDNPTHDVPRLRVDAELVESVVGLSNLRQLGRGVLCATCHSTLLDPAILDTWIVPHYATQANVFLGEGFFFVEDAHPAYHITEISNSCTGCHMGSTIDGKQPSNHYFRVNLDVCLDCHEQGEVDPQEEQDIVLTALKELESDINALLLSYLKLGLDAGRLGISELNEAGKRGRAEVAFSAGTSSNLTIRLLAPSRLALEFDLDGKPYMSLFGDIEADGKRLLDLPGGKVLFKAARNLLLIANDGSGGLHNPSLVMDVIERTHEKVSEVSFSALEGGKP